MGTLSSQTDRAQAIRMFILRNVTEHPEHIVRVTARKFGLSRQAILAAHVNRLLSEGLLAASGTTRARKYRLTKKSRSS